MLSRTVPLVYLLEFDEKFVMKEFLTPGISARAPFTLSLKDAIDSNVPV